MGQAQELNGGVHGFVERYSAWTGYAWLEVRGTPSRTLRIAKGYGELRTALRSEHPHLPFDSEWSDGHYPAAPFGLPLGPVAVAGWAVGGGLCVLAAGLVGTAGAMGAFLVSVWPLVRLTDAVTATSHGLRVGPPWAPLVPWHEVLEVRIQGYRVWVRAVRGGASAPMPRSLVPALRARLRRIGALQLVDGGPDTNMRYAVWRQVAPAIPWGVMAGTLAAAWLTPDPWRTVAVGLLVVAGTALLGAVIEARGSGWGGGGVFWLTLLHALLLGLLAVGNLVAVMR